MLSSDIIKRGSFRASGLMGVGVRVRVRVGVRVWVRAGIGVRVGGK
jgi:hypothetical protein